MTKREPKSLQEQMREMAERLRSEPKSREAEKNDDREDTSESR